MHIYNITYVCLCALKQNRIFALYFFVILRLYARPSSASFVSGDSDEKFRACLFLKFTMRLSDFCMFFSLILAGIMTFVSFLFLWLRFLRYTFFLTIIFWA